MSDIIWFYQLALIPDFSMNIKSSATQSLPVLRINTYNLFVRVLSQLSQLLRPITCGLCPENGQLRSLIVRYG